MSIVEDDILNPCFSNLLSAVFSFVHNLHSQPYKTRFMHGFIVQKYLQAKLQTKPQSAKMTQQQQPGQIMDLVAKVRIQSHFNPLLNLKVQSLDLTLRLTLRLIDVKIASCGVKISQRRHHRENPNKNHGENRKNRNQRKQRLCSRFS